MQRSRRSLAKSQFVERLEVGCLRKLELVTHIHRIADALLLAVVEQMTASKHLFEDDFLFAQDVQARLLI
jgi:hypothetical protein